MIPAGRRAQSTQPRRRRNLIGTRVGHNDRNTKWPRIERRDHHLLLQPKRRRGRDAAQHVSQLGSLRLDLASPGSGISLPSLLINPQRLTLITGPGANRSTLHPFLLLLRSPPRTLLRITLTLLTALRLGPGSHHTAGLPACHRFLPRWNNTTAAQRAEWELP